MCQTADGALVYTENKRCGPDTLCMPPGCFGLKCFSSAPNLLLSTQIKIGQSVEKTEHSMYLTAGGAGNCKMNMEFVEVTQVISSSKCIMKIQVN